MGDGDEPRYRDDDAPLDRRVEDLLGRMTLTEKAGQVVGMAPLQDRHTVDEVAAAVGDAAVGSVSPIPLAFTDGNGPVEFARFANRMQRLAVEETRLGVPLLVTVDAVHGHAFVDGATVFPHNLGMAATRDPDLVRAVAETTAREMRATGTALNYSPTADVLRDPRWGRTLETYGESPYLCAELTAAEVRGYQGRGLDSGEAVAATAKHFPAYGDPERGEDTAPVDRSTATIHRTFLPPFRAAIAAGVECVMPTYSAVGVEPAHGSARFLTDLLRDDLGFEGLVVSDWNGVAMLHEDHKTAATLEAAVEGSVGAGLDVASVGGPSHGERLVSLVERGAIPEARLDESVRRVLSLKFRLGLFADPFVDAEAAVEALGGDEARALARECARRSQTLLRNEDDLLPLVTDADEVFVTGPNADDLAHQCGGWTAADVTEGTTILEGIERTVGEGTTVTYERGSGFVAVEDVDAAAVRAADADVAVVVLGEGAYIHEFVPPSLSPDRAEEFPSRSQVALPAAQRRLLEAVEATGTPTVLVLVSGRPLAISWAAEHVPAILWSYYPGSEGGAAVADVLFGRSDPGGRLPVSVPRSAGHLPTRFNHLPNPTPVAEGGHPPSYDPLFAFGHGLSYAAFAYEELELSDETVGPDGSIEIAVTVANVGDRPGRDAVDVFASDAVSSHVTPVRELVGFGSVELDPGERETVRTTVDASDLAVVGPDGERAVEPGAFEVTCGDRTAAFEVRD